MNEMNKEKPDLYEERMHGYGGAYNNTQNYLNGLDELCKFHKMDRNHTVLELGTNDGVSTSLFAYYAKEVTTIDLNKSDKLQKKLELYLKLTRGKNVEIISEIGDLAEFKLQINFKKMSIFDQKKTISTQ